MCIPFFCSEGSLKEGDKNDFKGNMLKREKFVCFLLFFWFNVFLHVVAFISVDIYNYPLGGQGKLSGIKTTDAVLPEGTSSTALIRVRWWKASY